MALSFRSDPQIDRFDRAPDGTAVDRVTLAHAGTTVRILTWGATVQDLRRETHDHPLVLGSPTLAPYLRGMLYFGAVVGRVANRIAQGRTSLDGRTVTLERNESGRCTLHGGKAGSSSVNWRIELADDRSCVLSVTLPDGQGGFPGAIHITATYRLDDAGALRIDLRATSDAPTLCNLAPHSYWNLDGTRDLSRHRLQVMARRYLPVDAQQIPLIAPADVAGTPFDHRALRPVAAGLDHCFCLDPVDGTLRPACILEAGSLRLRVLTDQPGLQVFDAHTVNTAPDVGLQGVPYGARAGVALEPQRWPDAPNRPEAASVLLRPGETSCQRSVFRFETIEDTTGAPQRP